MKDEIKEILDKFDKVLENYELDKKWGQMSVDSICHLFPSEMVAIKDYINNLQKKYDKTLEDSVKETHKLMAIRKYLKDNEREYGSLEDNEKIILRIIEGK